MLILCCTWGISSPSLWRRAFWLNDSICFHLVPLFPVFVAWLAGTLLQIKETCTQYFIVVFVQSSVPYSHPFRLNCQIKWWESTFCLLLQSSSTTSIQTLWMGSLPFLVVSFTLQFEVNCSVEQWVLLLCLISCRTTRHVAFTLCLVLVFGRLVLCSLFLSPKVTSSSLLEEVGFMVHMLKQWCSSQESQCILSSVVCSQRFVTSEVNDRHDPFPPFSLCAHQVCAFPQMCIHHMWLCYWKPQASSH